MVEAGELRRSHCAQPRIERRDGRMHGIVHHRNPRTVGEMGGIEGDGIALGRRDGDPHAELCREFHARGASGEHDGTGGNVACRRLQTRHSAAGQRDATNSNATADRSALAQTRCERQAELARVAAGVSGKTQRAGDAVANGRKMRLGPYGRAWVEYLEHQPLCREHARQSQRHLHCARIPEDLSDPKSFAPKSGDSDFASSSVAAVE